jgi:hypothetical protein
MICHAARYAVNPHAMKRCALLSHFGEDHHTPARRGAVDMYPPSKQ